MNREIPRCSTCLMPRTTKSISFDAYGKCSLCKEHIGKTNINTQRLSLDGAIESIKERGKGKEYDCLVGVSGGKDSIYLLGLLVRNHKLRCLAAYYRTPFTPQVIDDNVKKITSILDVPLIEMNLSQEYHRTVTAEFVKEWKKTKEQIIVNLACSPCKLLHRELYSIAREHKIPTIVHGDNKYEHAPIAAGQFRSNTMDRYSLSTNLLRLFIIAKRGFNVLLRHPIVFNHLGLIFKSSMLYLNPYTAYLRLRYPKIVVFNYFDVACWVESECDKSLNDLGWQLPKGLFTNKKADCTFAHLKNLMTSQSAGADYFDCLFSNMVRYGLLERSQALNRLMLEGASPLEHIDETYRILGLPLDYLEFKQKGP